MPTIPDLQELTSLTLSSFIPVDSGIQSYKVSFENLIKSLYKGFRQTVSKTATFSVAAGDSFNLYLADLSSAAFDGNLPAVGTGLQFQFKKIDTTLNALTIKDASSNVITTLNTKNESVTIAANAAGDGWIVATRYVPCESFDITITSNLSTNVTTPVARGRRFGQFLQIEMSQGFTGANTQAVTPTFTLPSTLPIDDTKMAYLSSYGSFPQTTWIIDNGSGTYSGIVQCNASTRAFAFLYGSYNGSNTGNSPLIHLSVNPNGNAPMTIAANDKLLTTVTIPILGWNA